MKRVTLFLCSLFGFVLLMEGTCYSQIELQPSKNQPERIEWFMEQGLGLFIHWSMDSQLGSVISHSMVGASDDYLDRFINELPQTFNPKRYDPKEWAVLAKLARSDAALRMARAETSAQLSPTGGQFPA